MDFKVRDCLGQGFKFMQMFNVFLFLARYQKYTKYFFDWRVIQPRVTF